MGGFRREIQRDSKHQALLFYIRAIPQMVEWFNEDDVQVVHRSDAKDNVRAHIVLDHLRNASISITCYLSANCSTTS